MLNKGEENTNKYEEKTLEERIREEECSVRSRAVKKRKKSRLGQR